MVEQQETIAMAPERAAELARSGEAQLVDVRGPYERDGGGIEGAKAIEMNELTARVDEIERDKPVVFFCRGGNRSRMAAEAFRDAGRDAHSIEGGLRAWVDAGLPLDPPDGEIRDPPPPSS